MIVVSLTDCPPKLRGDITKWLMEINTGVYVGNLSARVRDELWERICKNIGDGRATMVFSASGEQKLGFYVHNTPWEPVDIDGITLIRRPNPGRISNALPKHFSNAAHRQMRNEKKEKTTSFCAIDLETSGLSPGQDEIIEFGAVRVRNGEIQEEFHAVVSTREKIQPKIVELTGITEEDIYTQGIPLIDALTKFVTFLGNDMLVAHNAAFDADFLRHACKECGIPLMRNRFADTMILAKRYLPKLKNYKLRAIADYYGLPFNKNHRALEDSRLAANIYLKLNE